MNNKLYILLITLLSLNCSKKSDGGNPPSLPAVSVDDIKLLEGNSGYTNAIFTIKLDKPTDKTVTVTCNTIDKWAVHDQDFVPLTNKQISLQPGETQVQLIVQIVGDDIKEGDEPFVLSLSNATNAMFNREQAVCTILNDDTKVPFTEAGYTTPLSYPGYTLAWSDECNDGKLNTTIWSYENGDGCPGICGWGNNEQEYYKPDNLFFQDGKMIIEARNDGYSGKPYTSTKILTRDKKLIKFARIDIRAKLPVGKGIWPAFWLLPQSNVYGSWPKSGEIDMMEALGHETNKVYGTAHYGPGPGSTQIGRNYVIPNGSYNDSFHVYSLIWKQDQIQWLVDDKLYSTVNKSDVGSNTYPFNEDFFFIINMAVGGNWPGNPDASTYFPQWLIVDYVRVFQ
ncbi:MAG: family 16 glycosylhydrolase [Filimonas sp.]|nr:family 16 glycosylhydrolase [Filimonas sp.]